MRTALLHRALVSAIGSLALAPLVACSSPPDTPAVHDAAPADTGADAPASADTGAPGADTGSGPTDSGLAGDTGTAGDGGCTPADTLDDPDDEGLDANCDGADGVVGKDVYVDATRGLSTNPGTPKAPLATLEQGIKLAVSRGGRVLVAAGSYSAERLDASGEWKLVGGYDASFLGKPSRALTTVNVPSTGLVLAIATKVTLAHLTVLGANADAKTPPSAHALRTSVDDLTLDDVLLRAGDGRSGVDGANGADGFAGKAVGSTGGGWGGQTLCAGGVFAGATSAGALGGSPSPDGKPAGVGSTPGSNGGDGAKGADGTDAARTPLLKGGLVEWPAAKPGLGDGTAGYGGAGGANLDVGGFVGLLRGGQGGQGGCPGGGGEAAESGGGSIALVLSAGKVTLKRSEVRTGVGGNGGNGGLGGVGGLGGAGGPKQCASSPSTLCSSEGGAGGRGGRGGHGGGGVGGWTIGIVTTGSAGGATTDAGTTFLLGAPGVGGEGASGYAAAGDKRNTLKLE